MDVAKTSTKAGFHYMWGLIISTVISSIGTIFIGNMLGSDAYGAYGIVLLVPNMIVIFRDWGINSAMIRYTAQYRAENRVSEVRSIFIAGLTFELILGVSLSIISFLCSGFIASAIFNRPELASFIQIVSISILSTGLISTATAAFTGTEVMTLNSVMLICQSTIKTVMILALVALGLGTEGAVVGYTIASVSAGIIGIALLLVVFRKLPKPFTFKLEIKEYTKEMLKYSVPLSLSTILSGFLAQFYAFLLPHFTADNVLIGNYNIAMTFVVLITFFSLPVTTMLFPAFSKLDAKRDNGTLKNAFQFSVKYAALLVVPVAALVMCLSEPAISTLFGDKYTSAPLFLALLSITSLLTASGNLSTGNILNSQGQTKLSFKLTLLTALIGFPMGYLLIMYFNVIGLIITSLISGIPSIVLGLIWVKKHYGLTVDWVSSSKILASSAIAATLTFLLVNSVSYSSVVRLFLGVFFYVLVLAAAFMFTRTLSIYDLNSLRSMTAGLGPVSTVLCRALDFFEKTMIMLKLAKPLPPLKS